MKLQRKTNLGYALAALIMLVFTAARGIQGFDLTPRDISFWLIPAAGLVLIGLFVWRQTRPIVYLRDGKVVVRGQEIDEEALEYWFYRKVTHNSHEVVLKYSGYSHHHIVLPEHDETFEDDRVLSFLRKHLSAPERSEVAEPYET